MNAHLLHGLDEVVTLALLLQQRLEVGAERVHRRPTVVAVERALA